MSTAPAAQGSGWESFDAYSVILYQHEWPATKPELSPEAWDALHREHVTFLQELRDSGQLLVNGPFDGGGGFVFLSTDLAEARRIAERDPFVAAGLRDVEVHTWRCPPGALTFNREALYVDLPDKILPSENEE